MTCLPASMHQRMDFVLSCAGSTVPEAMSYAAFELEMESFVHIDQMFQILVSIMALWLKHGDRNPI